MPKKVFDLLPPYPQPTQYHHHMSKGKREKVKSRKTFLFFFFGLFFIGVFLILMKMGNGSISNQTQNTTKDKSQFELFNNQGDSNLTGVQKPIIVRILNGAGQTNNVSVAQDLLLHAGFEIEKTNQADNNSVQTIIYYKNGHVNQAQKAADALKPSFAAQLQESINLESNYDILITIGVK